MGASARTSRRGRENYTRARARPFVLSEWSCCGIRKYLPTEAGELRWIELSIGSISDHPPLSLPFSPCSVLRFGLEERCVCWEKNCVDCYYQSIDRRCVVGRVTARRAALGECSDQGNYYALSSAAPSRLTLAGKGKEGWGVGRVFSPGNTAAPGGSLVMPEVGNSVQRMQRDGPSEGSSLVSHRSKLIVRNGN